MRTRREGEPIPQGFSRTVSPMGSHVYHYRLGDLRLRLRIPGEKAAGSASFSIHTADKDRLDHVLFEKAL